MPALRYWPLLPAIVVFSTIRLIHLEVAPIWDGADYTLFCLAEAFHKGFSWYQLDCAGHSSSAFMALVFFFIYPFGLSVTTLNLATLLLGCVGLIYFHKILETILSGKSSLTWRWTCALLTLCLAVHPVFLASSLNFNLDFGVTVFFLLFFFYWTQKKKLQTLIFATALLLTKESGWLVFGAALGSFLAAGIARKIPAHRKLQLIKQSAYLALPPLVLLCHLVGKTWLGKPLIFVGNTLSIPELLSHFLRLHLWDKVFLAFSSNALVLNFQWVASLAIIASMCAPAAPPSLKRARLRHLTLLFLLSWYFLTRYPTYNNARYVLPLAPFLLLVFSFALERLLPAARPRLLFLTLLAALWGASLYRTLDPASKWIYGTFSFGNRQLLRLVSLTGECCGHGRDQSVYNLEYTNYHHLQNEVMRHIQPDRVPFVTPHPRSNWLEFGDLRKGTYERGPLSADRFRPLHFAGPEAVLALPEKPAHLYFVASPFYKTEPALRQLLDAYTIVSRKEFLRNGYGMEVYELRKSVEGKKEGR